MHFHFFQTKNYLKWFIFFFLQFTGQKLAGVKYKEKGYSVSTPGMELLLMERPLAECIYFQLSPAWLKNSDFD